jgi:hypothetical protein
MSENISEVKKVIDLVFGAANQGLDIDLALFVKQVQDIDGQEKDEIISLIGERGLSFLQKLLSKKLLLKLLSKIIL